MGAFGALQFLTLWAHQVVWEPLASGWDEDIIEGSDLGCLRVSLGSK